MRPDKESCDFTGTWFTEGGSRIRVRNGMGTVLSSPHEYIIGWQFPIDEHGICCVTPNMNIKERDRTCDGYEG